MRRRIHVCHMRRRIHVHPRAPALSAACLSKKSITKNTNNIERISKYAVIPLFIFIWGVKDGGNEEKVILLGLHSR